MWPIIAQDQDKEGQLLHNLSGKCLVARPSIKDPMFRRSVVFIYENSVQGTAGLVLTQLQGTHNTHQLVSSRGFDHCAVPSEPLWLGGPVNEKAVIMLHSTDWRSSNTMTVDRSFAITSDDMMIYKYTTGDTPRYYRFYMGHSVWHPQQIKAEINNNNWLITTLNIDTIFENDGRHLWDIAVEHAAQETIDRFI